MGAVEVREVVIKALVVHEDATVTGMSSPSANDNSNAEPGEQTIKNSVERILEILKAKNER